MADPESIDGLLLDRVGDVPVVRLSRSQRVFEHAVEQFAAMLRRLVVEGHFQVLLDVGDAGFAPPTTVDRLRMVREWAVAADGRLRIAMVARPEFIDPERFGVVAAANFGLVGQVFDNETEALAWLDDERAAELRRNAKPEQG